LLKQDGMGDVKTILMVGGFSECRLMIERIKTGFPDLHVICPTIANTAVLQGAVMFGYSPQIISERSSPGTYEICVNVPFIEGVHPEICKYFNGGTSMCTDVFKVVIRTNETVIAGKTVKEHTCRSSSANDSVAFIGIY